MDKRTTGLAAPCTAVDLAGGVAIVKDFGRPTGYLLVPTRRNTGIEDPALLAPDAPNYWQKAWSARSYMVREAGRAVDREDIGMAVNAIEGRSQAQLHMHIDCVRSDVKDALAKARHRLTHRWSDLTLLGHLYRVRTLRDADLGSTDPFKLLAERDSGATKMGGQTLVLVGSRFRADEPGFYVISGKVTPTYNGHGEELLDHKCAVLRPQE